MKNYFTQLLFLPLILLTSCSRDSESGNFLPSHQNQLYFQHDLILNKDSQLTTAELALFRQIRTKQPIGYQELTNAFIEMQISEFNSSSDTDLTFNQIQTFVNGLVSSASNARNPHDLKVRYEKRLDELFEPKTFDYLEGASNIGDIYREGVADCYSATSLFEIVYRQSITLDDLQYSYYIHHMSMSLSIHSPRCSDQEPPQKRR